MLSILKDPIDAFLTRQGWEAARDGLPALLRDRVDEEWKPLFTPLAELRADDTLLTVPLIDASRAQTAQVGHWTWSLQGSAEARIEVDVLEAEPSARFKFRWQHSGRGDLATDVTVIIQPKGWGSVVTLTSLDFLL